MEENSNISDGVTPHNTTTQQLSLQFRPRSNSETSDDFKHKIRKSTDIYFLEILTTFLVVFFCCLCYCIVNGDIYRILNEYDNCGNACGRRKTAISLRSHYRNICVKTTKEEIMPPYQIILKIDLNYNRTCVSNCSAYPGYRQFLNKCIPDDNQPDVPDVDIFLQKVSDDFKILWPEFCFLYLIAFGLSFIVLILLRHFPDIVVWVNMICIPLSFAGGGIFLWMMVVQNMNQHKPGSEKITTAYIVGAIALSVTTLILALVIIYMRKQIRLVVQLLKEASKAIIAMPIILLVPIPTFVILVVIYAVWFYLVLWIESSGQIEQSYVQSAISYYEQNGFVQFTRWYNLVAMMWMVQFVIGCQDMVVAGAISKWYFERNKDTLRSTSTIIDSFYNLVRYHLGSVAFGSSVITIIGIIRILLQFIRKVLERVCIHLCIACTENGCSIATYILRYVTRNAYIQVATHGCTFYEGGKRAFTLLSSNKFRVVKINSVGHFVLFHGKLLVVIATVLIGVNMLGHNGDVQHLWVPICIAAVFSFLVAHCCVTIYEITVDTIFLCFCEDCEENDGITKQYYMSKNLMEFVENSKKIIEAQEAKCNICQNT